MTDNQNPFAGFGLERAIAPRWALRDIKGNSAMIVGGGFGDNHD
jgi:hypothetical protein